MNKIILASLLSLLLFNKAYAKDVKLIVKEIGREHYKSLTVNESEVELIKNDSKYLTVEEDVWLKAPKPTVKQLPLNIKHIKRSSNKQAKEDTANNEPNDPEFSNQYYWLSKDLYAGSSEILSAVNKSVQNKKLRIAVIDGGFEDHEDLVWSAGYNFFDEWGEVRGEEFRDLTDEQKDCTGGHGLGIASIIGAIKNNNLGIAGVVDAELIAARSLSCGLGTLSDIADAITWAAGGTVENVPSITKVDMINISMGGELPSCPTYLQSAIDFANKQGVKIFVAAGNQNVDALGIAPARCSGVFVTGATEREGYKTEFSNFGTKVDVMMAGYDILGYSSNGVVGWWEGTSQASPLALSVAALGLQHNPELTRDEIFTFLKTTASPIREDISSADQDCSGDRCGAGLVNANKFMDYVIASTNGGIYKLRHALSPESSCSQELYLSQFGNSLPLCKMYEFVIADGEGKNENNYQIFRVINNESMIEENAELILSSDEKTVLLEGIDLESYDYGVQICLNDACDDTPIIKINIDGATLPEVCP